MAKQKVKLSFILLSVPVKVDFAKNTVTKMTGNAFFATPAVSMAAMQAAAVDLETKYNAAQVGGELQTAEQDAAELVLDDLLRKQAAYVTAIADGNEVKIFSAGFQPTKKDKEPIPLPTKVENMKLKPAEQAGSFSKINDKTANAKVYVTLLSTNPVFPVTVDGNLLVVQMGADKLIIDVSTERKRTYENLTSATKIYVKTSAFNAAGKGPDSDTVNITVP